MNGIRKKEQKKNEKDTKKKRGNETGRGMKKRKIKKKREQFPLDFAARLIKQMKYLGANENRNGDKEQWRQKCETHEKKMGGNEKELKIYILHLS